MLYLLSGAARAGKTRIARRFLERTGVPFFSLDFLMMAAANGLPDLSVDTESDERLIAKQLWPIVDPMARAMVEEEIDYLIEGAQLLPEHAAALVEWSPKAVRACFIGYADCAVDDKLKEIRHFGGGEDDWMRHLDDDAVRADLRRLIDLSGDLREACGRLDLPFVEAEPFKQNATAEAVIHCLTSGKEKE